jgi:hypothetical protein
MQGWQHASCDCFREQWGLPLTVNALLDSCREWGGGNRSGLIGQRWLKGLAVLACRRLGRGDRWRPFDQGRRVRLAPFLLDLDHCLALTGNFSADTSVLPTFEQLANGQNSPFK